MTTRALVLGGGGITGIAWETGLLAGLAAEGVDLTGADRVIGTSAGSIVGAQITSDLDLDELYRRQLLPPADLGDGGVPLASIGLGVMVKYATAMLQSRGDVERFCRVLAAKAVRAASNGAVPSVAERYEQVAQRIGGLTWPERDLRVTAIDAETGALVAFGPEGDHPDASLEDAVNASCAVPCVYPPIPIDGRLYVDGGARSGSNADLAAGCDVVVAISPLDRSIGTQRSATSQLRDLGVPYVVITPDAEARAAIGKNILDPAARPPSARAGFAQAKAHVDALRDLWL
ncbi:patatin-like phospholipase family protein [Aeromicrobium terrae]|uniref:Patatin-like phospholipase family protein n=1 Tax=Aeromicrobium terrae TaxID=2498846 RepID=A0A5C8NE93_9ACTN|nr:patatin-like phospholipase family protein [Aeromicrobium terrae]TXL56645.1 patatin-like phospholipase family protein [Aeromicrobium terrae]